MDVQSEIDERPFLVVIIVCNEHVIVLTNTANVLYQRYILGENFAVREQCLNFKRMELECNKYNEKLRIFKTERGSSK